MNREMWDEIRHAVVSVRKGPARRIDGEGYKVYRVPQDVIRIDLPQSKEDTDEPKRTGVELREA